MKKSVVVYLLLVILFVNLFMNFISAEIVINSVKPTTTILGYPTEFEVNISAENGTKIKKYEWNFGDGSNITTQTNKTIHTYNQTGEFELKIIVDNSSAIFNISVNLPDNFINTTLKNNLRYIEKVKSQINNFSDFYRESLNSVINLDDLEKKLKDIEKNYSSAAGAEEYMEIMDELLGLKIPKSVIVHSAIDSTTFYPDESNIDLEILKEIGGGDYNEERESKYIKAVNNWFIENLDLKISYDEIIVRYEKNEPVLKIFELEINEKEDLNEYYIVLKELDNLKFKKDYSEKSESGYIYIPGDEGKIVFSTTEDIEVINLPVFISPPLTKLKIPKAPKCNLDGICDKEKGESWKNCKDCSYSKIIAVVMISLLLIGILIYIAMQEWYKKKYENYLFKNRNSLYNLVQYIHHAKTNGIEEKKIKSNLKKAGWSGEQIRYALRKYEGKRTGMIEIPNLFSRLKKPKEKSPEKKNMIRIPKSREGVRRLE